MAQQEEDTIDIDFEVDEAFDENPNANPHFEVDDPDEDPSLEKDEEIEEENLEEDESLEEDEIEEDDSEEDEEDEEQEEDSSIVEDIYKNFGLEFNEEQLAEIEDPNSLDGVINATKQIASSEVNRQIEEYMEAHPQTKKLIEFEQKGGDPDEFIDVFYPKDDFTQVKLDEDNLDQQRTILKQSMSDSGMDKEKIDQRIKRFEDSGILYDEAEIALDGLVKEQESRKETLIEQQEQEHQRQLKEQQEMMDKVRETIHTADSINGIKIPENEKDKFFKYITQPVENGMSQRDIDTQKAGLEERLLVDYLLYSGFKLDDLVKAEARSQNANNLKDRLKKSKAKNKSDDPNIQRGVGDTEDIEFDF